MTDRRYDVVVIGGGHNGLVCAASLARAGLRTLVLERRREPGGAVLTAEIAPGYRGPVLAQTVGRLRASVIAALDLEAHGLELLQPEVRAFAPEPDGGAVTLWGDPRRTAEELRSRSAADADAYIAFDRRVRVLASFLAHVHAATPPDPSRADAAGIRGGFELLLAFRRLPPPVRREVLRVLPMAAGDLLGETFETDAVRAVLASRGVRYTAMGPRSAGTAAVLLQDSVAHDRGAAGEAAFARGGPGGVTRALVDAARAYDAGIRTETEVAAVTTRRARATGLVLADGEEIHARAVVSAVDPKRTLSMVDPVELGPTLGWRADGIRTMGTVAKVNLALEALPEFPGAKGETERLRGRIVVAPTVEYLERASDATKYGRMSERPFLEATIPSLVDPSLAPEGRHVMSVLVQYAPYRLREGDWDAERDRLRDVVLGTLEAVAPGLTARVGAAQVLTPLDLERDHGLTEGHPMHGEHGLDQFFAWRPLLGMARYRMPVDGLYLCGAGAHPGGGITGGPGANAAREILADLRRRDGRAA